LEVTMLRTFGIQTLLLMFVIAAPAIGKAWGESVVSQGQPRAEIVAAETPFYSFVAGELQKYIERFSGAGLKIISADAVRETPQDVALILLGGPEVNPLVRRAVSDRLVNFDGLKADGFILRSIHLNGRAALVVGGNDEAGTMYGVYDLLERYGAVFLLTGDILPEKKADLPWLNLEVREEPTFARRGLNVTSNMRHARSCRSNGGNGGWIRWRSRR
jgi:hypothetical protein